MKGASPTPIERIRPPAELSASLVAGTAPQNARARESRSVARVMSAAPARVAGLDGHGRPLAAGEPANLTLVDPTARAVVDRAASASLSRNNPWHGRELPDPVVATFWAGRATYRRS